MDCINFETCGFIKKHSEEKALAVKGFIKMYCQGEKQEECIRKQYKKAHGTAPSDDMMPNGATMSHN